MNKKTFKVTKRKSNTLYLPSLKLWSGRVFGISWTTWLSARNDGWLAFIRNIRHQTISMERDRRSNAIDSLKFNYRMQSNLNRTAKFLCSMSVYFVQCLLITFDVFNRTNQIKKRSNIQLSLNCVQQSNFNWLFEFDLVWLAPNRQ